MERRTISALELSSTYARFVPLARDYSYVSKPPVLANIEDIVPAWRERTETILNRTEAKLPPAWLVELDDATVFLNGFVVTKDGTAIQETLRSGNQEELPDQPPVDYVEDLTLLLRKPGDTNFGHWLVEICPRVLEFKAIHGDTGWKVAVPNHPLSMRALRAESLRWLGISEDRIIWLKGDPVQFRKLAFITSNSIHSHTHDYNTVLKFRKAALQAVGEIKTPQTRLYVGRKPDQKRRLVNEAEVIALLEQHGFQTVYPEDFSVLEQVSLFANASAIAGISGAALTNILFSPASCQVLSMMPNHGLEFFFWDIANIVGQKYSYMVGQSTNPEQLGHSDFSIDLTQIKAWLDTLV